MKLNQVLLCKPDYFRVDYAINPWMKIGAVKLDKAQKQWQQLRQAYLATGIKATIIDQQPDCPDMVFAADQAIRLSDKTFLVSSFRYPERRAETNYYQAWFKSQNYKLIESIESEIFFEGSGDCLIWKKNIYLMGVGHRNSINSSETLNQLTQKTFIPLELISEKFYHLDTCLFILDSITAFYHPPAFSQASIAKLTELFPRLIPVLNQEANNFCLNSVVHKNWIFIQTGNPYFCQTISNFGYQPIELDLSEFMKSGGGIHCLTQFLDYDL